jgi:hypothetical protein
MAARLRLAASRSDLSSSPADLLTAKSDLKIVPPDPSQLIAAGEKEPDRLRRVRGYAARRQLDIEELCRRSPDVTVLRAVLVQRERQLDGISNKCNKL